jgi:hypothetical protein
MNENEILLKCDTCGNQFQHGFHHYEGHCIAKYKIIVCDSCWKGNSDGWASVYESKLLLHLKNNQLSEPQRNDAGRLPRD